MSLILIENGSCANVAYLCPNDVTHILSQWATWMSGQVRRALCLLWCSLFVNTDKEIDKQ